MSQPDTRLRETVTAFAAYVTSLPGSLVSPRAWGAREVLAHIAYWHERYVEIIEAALLKREPSPLQGTFRELNARAVQTMAGKSVTAMAARLLDAQHRLELIAPAASQRRLRVAIKPGARAWSIDELLSRVEGHVRGHHVTLRRQLGHAATRRVA